LLNKKANKANLEAVSHWLVEFQYQKFDEIEVPGQYLKVSRLSLFARMFTSVLTSSLCPSPARGQQRQLRPNWPLCEQV
jgi:hypothetical protein